MLLQLAVALYIYKHYALKEKRKKRTVVTKATVHKQGSVQRFKVSGRLKFSGGHTGSGRNNLTIL
jgi:hypothetical protein